MKISALNNVMPKPNQIIEKKEEDGGFGSILNAAMKGIDNTNKLEKNADKLSQDFIMGKTDNIHSVMIAQEKASVALQFTTQVRNKVMESYNEIMRMPV